MSGPRLYVSHPRRMLLHACLCSSAELRWATSDCGKRRARGLRIPAGLGRCTGRTSLASMLRVRQIAEYSGSWNGVGWKSREVCEVLLRFILPVFPSRVPRPRVYIC